MKKNCNWTILLIGGPSGTGKSRLAYKLAEYYGINVMEIDDIHAAVEAATTYETHPAIHYWSTGVNWKEIGVEANLEWLTSVSKELMPALKAVMDNHLESGIPVIIEGDFISPEFAGSLADSRVKAIFVHESDNRQIVQNYREREGGNLQQYRADISSAYGAWIKERCEVLGIKVMEARPWETGLDRAIEEGEL